MNISESAFAPRLAPLGGQRGGDRQSPKTKSNVRLNQLLPALRRKRTHNQLNECSIVPAASLPASVSEQKSLYCILHGHCCAVTEDYTSPFKHLSFAQKHFRLEEKKTYFLFRLQTRSILAEIVEGKMWQMGRCSSAEHPHLGCFESKQG